MVSRFTEGVGHSRDSLGVSNCAVKDWTQCRQSSRGYRLRGTYQIRYGKEMYMLQLSESQGRQIEPGWGVWSNKPGHVVGVQYKSITFYVGTLHFLCGKD